MLVIPCSVPSMGIPSTHGAIFGYVANEQGRKLEEG